MLNSTDLKAFSVEADVQLFNFLVHRKMEDQLQGSSLKSWKLSSFAALKLRSRLKTELMILWSLEQNQRAIQMTQGIWLSVVFRNIGIPWEWTSQISMANLLFCLLPYCPISSETMYFNYRLSHCSYNRPGPSGGHQSNLDNYVQ